MAPAAPPLPVRTLPRDQARAENAGVAEEAMPQAVALLPAELLQSGEIIILLLKPSPWFIILGCLKTLFVVGVLLALALGLSNAAPAALAVLPQRADMVLLAVLAGGVRLFWQFLEWLGRLYVLTDRRVIRIRGVIGVQVFEAPLKHIQHTTLLFSLRERLFGLGTLGFATSGTGLIEAHWTMVARPMEVHQTVVQALERYR